jgi:flagellin-like hook-associated protein FlgL
MKEQTLIQMKNQLETLGSIIQRMHQELSNLSDLSIGTHEIVKRIEGYDAALEKLKEDHIKKTEESPGEGLIE